MLILAVDTAGEGVSLALGDEARVWSIRRAAARSDEALWPALEALLRKAKLRLVDVEGVACAVGPGRFTAVRVGATFADMLARARGVPAVGLTRFEAFASRLPPAEGTVALVIPSFREESFVQLWGRKGPAGKPFWVRAGGLDEAVGKLPRVDASAADAAGLLAPARRLLARRSRPPLRPLYLKPANYAKP